jgi:acetyl esterase/lipase
MKKQIVVAALMALSLVSCGTTSTNQATSASTSEAPVNYTLTTGLKYGSVSAAEIGDMYVPKDATTTTPGVVLIHGGAFTMGNEKMFATTAKWLANHGLAVYCVHYRLLSEMKFPGAVGDIKAAVRYLRKNATNYNINPDQIVTWGESAGAYLSVMATMTGGTDKLDAAVTDNADISSKVNACVDFYGPCCVKKYKDMGLCNFLGISSSAVDDEANADLVSSSDPLTYVTNFTTTTAPRILIQHGGADTTVSNNESHYLYDGLSAEYGTSKVTLEIKDGLHHMDSGFYTDENMTAVVSSLTSYFAA